MCLVAKAPALASLPPNGFLDGNSRTNCIYSNSSLSALSTMSSLAGANFDCVMLFNDAKPTWADWTNAWWVNPPSPDADWLGWLSGDPGRRLIISQPMVPDDAPSNWRALGAAGDYDAYAVQLATNLVNEGMGSSIIRLGWEGNDPVDAENSIGSTPTDYADWAQYWANIVQAMKSVPGADFQFDWTVNQYYEPLPFQDWYPGDNVVDIIGIDAYDNGIYQSGLTLQQHWADLYNEQDGLAAVAAFALAHNKPLSIPEWSLAPVGSTGGAGDDPVYVQGLAAFIADNDVEYNSYFYGPAASNLLYLPDAPLSLAAYDDDFWGQGGAGGQPSASTTVPTTTVPTTAPTTAPSTVPTAAQATTTLPLPGAPGTSAPSPGSGPGAGAGAPPTSRPVVPPAAPTSTVPGSPTTTAPGLAVEGHGSVPTASTTPAGSRPTTAPMGGVPVSFVDVATIGGQVARMSTSSAAVQRRFTPGARPVVAIAATADGHGYWLVSRSGHLSGYGDARLYPRSAGPSRFSAPVVAMAATADGHGYWLVSRSGQVSGYGDARLYPRSAGPSRFSAPVVAMAATADGHGYWLVSRSGHLSGYGDARTYGAPRAPSAAVALVPDGMSTGYWVVLRDGQTRSFGTAGHLHPAGISPVVAAG
jgi:hypothetical protein